MRIISGKYKGRKLSVNDKDEFRPTTGKTKEGIFSILTSGQFLNDGKSVIENAVVLDLFAGSGALSFEALSRGANKAVIVEVNQTNLNYIKENSVNLGIEKDIVIIKGDATNLPKAKLICDIIFVDPPYKSNLLLNALNSLVKEGWLKNGSIIICETAKTEKNEFPKNYNLVTERSYGKTKISILEYKNNI